MKVASLFSGCGGLDLGFKNAKFEIVYANEFDQTIWDTYHFNHCELANVSHGLFLDKRDIRNVGVREIPDCDGIIGGPPCQSWSAAGLRLGADDPRGKLFWEYVRILKAKQPLFFLAENVEGILSKRHKASLSEILQLFTNAGYNVTYACLNCSEYGVPQDRKRVFFIGYRQDLGKTFDFRLIRPQPWVNLRDAIADLQYAEVCYPAVNESIPNHEYVEASYSSQFMSRQRVRNWNNSSFTILASARHIPLHPQANPMLQSTRDVWLLDPATPAPYRRLTVRECARIQTFPDNFIFKYTNIVNGYKMVGNAVPPKMAQLIADVVMEDLVG